MSEQRCRSSVVIARMLDCEGFDAHTANMVRRWYKTHVANPQTRKRFEKAKRAFQETIVPKLTDADRIVLGNWVAQEFAAAFVSGLRMGLTTQMYPIEDET